MKQVLLGIVAFFCIIMAYAFTSTSKISSEEWSRNVKWMTWEEAVKANAAAKAAGKKPKKIFVDIYTDWCGWCKKMDTETFEQVAIAAYLNEHFYPVKFNAEQKETIVFDNQTFKYIENGQRGYHELAVALLAGKMSYPTVVFISEEFQLLQRIPGYLNISDFDMIMHYLAEEHYTQTPWAEFQKKYSDRKKNVNQTSDNHKN